MRNSALIMSGFGVHDPWPPGREHRASSSTTRRTTTSGPVTVMGFSHPNGSQSGGKAVGQAYVSYLAHHPATARRIADKLVTRFVSDEPMPALAARLATTYLANDTAIVPVLRAAVLQRGVPHATRAPRSSDRWRTWSPRAARWASPRTRARAPTGCRRCGGSPTASATCRWRGRCPTATPTSPSTGSPPTRPSSAGTCTWPWPASGGRSATSTRATRGARRCCRRRRWRPCCPARCRRRTARSSTRWRSGSSTRRWRRRRGRRCCAFLGKTPTSTLKSTDAAVGWKLPYVVGAGPRLRLPRDALSERTHGRSRRSGRPTALRLPGRDRADARASARRAFLRRSGGRRRAPSG